MASIRVTEPNHLRRMLARRRRAWQGPRGINTKDAKSPPRRQVYAACASLAATGLLPFMQKGREDCLHLALRVLDAIAVLRLRALHRLLALIHGAKQAALWLHYSKPTATIVFPIRVEDAEKT
jgi:hypothetical protein